MHKRTKACAISKKTKLRVYERDKGRCIFCGAPGLPEAHYIPRSHGGLGIEQNIVTACRLCHDKLDNSTQRQQMLPKAAEHLRRHYPDWNEKDLIYDKWQKPQKDKAKKQIEKSKHRKNEDIKSNFAEKPQKDKAKEPPEGFYFLEGEDG